VKPLPWVDDPRTTPDLLLQRLREKAPHLLRTERGIDFDPWWRKKRGYFQEKELEPTPENLRAFNAERASDPLMEGMRIEGMPWGAGWMCICAGVAKWAQGALTHILGLEKDLEEATGLASRRGTRVVELEAQVVALEARAQRAETSLAETQVALQETTAQGRAALQEAEGRWLDVSRELRSSRSSEEAWKVSAESAHRALEVLRVATKITLEGEGTALARRDG
jgi:hypothetical protein